jgi:hypothetical protein
MDEIQAKAFKIALIYLELAPKFFPDYQHYRLPKGDPRKSDLFRYCHKLVREKQGKIADSDFKLYVRAQLEIMRGIRRGDSHPFITPSCLAGDKAWKRWLLWKSRYDKLIESRASSAVADTIDIHTDQKIKKDLWKTKQFFLAWFDRLDVQDIRDALSDNNFFLWVTSGSVCGYYLILSPIFNTWLKSHPIDLLKKYGVDLNVYKNANKPELHLHFKEEFPHETRQE